MKTPLARVEWICEDEVRASIDVPLCSGELAVSDDGEWVGLVTSVRQGAVVLRSLDPPERLVVGQLLRFLGSDHLPDMDSLRWGSVIDPLGRVLHDGPRGRNPILGTHTRSFWGLGRLETAFEVPRGSSLVIAGDGSVGIAKLMAEALRRQTADWAAVVCQGGLRELNRLIDGAVDAGTVEKTIFIWSPLWSRPALSQLIPQCLKKVCQAAPQGHGLILFDDLRRWIETGREWSEESGQDLLASGFSPLCRIGVARLLDMPARGIETSVSLLAGWTVDRTSPRLTEHPYGRLVELLTDQGIVLENRQERLRPRMTAGDAPPWPFKAERLSKRLPMGTMTPAGQPRFAWPSCSTACTSLSAPARSTTSRRHRGVRATTTKFFTSAKRLTPCRATFPLGPSGWALSPSTGRKPLARRFETG